MSKDVATKINKSKPIGVRFNEYVKIEFGDGLSYQKWLTKLEDYFLQKNSTETIGSEKKTILPVTSSDSTYPKNFNELLKIAKDKSYDDIDSFKLAVNSCSLNTNQIAMILSKIDN